MFLLFCCSVPHQNCLVCFLFTSASSAQPSLGLSSYKLYADSTYFTSIALIVLTLLGGRVYMACVDMASKLE
ncbi:hypothetical protein L211DRAFT_843244 [Terfezia boudieri ATCC MYA-4762]|uniref:Uncharacterized protein n=1 Tax=Terfezia boudieri ATCC MYA-4762 TaxID=1051890 RepID=A0A3N4LBD9_9PEZI|nr:hypothetical protein L211DRAFT_843244 [Terfezia boudieri ATCC MYA-4762]